MSDKTCGKCAVWAHVANDIGVCSVGGTTVGEDDFFEIRSEFDNCRHLDSYKPYEFTIEQRYEKLESVAREMLLEIEHCESYYHDVMNVDWRAMLEDCGVSIDD